MQQIFSPYGEPTAAAVCKSFQHWAIWRKTTEYLCIHIHVHLWQLVSIYMNMYINIHLSLIICTWECFMIHNISIIVPVCYGMNSVPQNSYIKGPSHNVIVLGGGAFGDIIRSWISRTGWVPSWEETKDSSLTCVLSLFLCHVHTARRWPSASQEENPHQEPKHPAPWSWTS